MTFRVLMIVISLSVVAGASAQEGAGLQTFQKQPTAGAPAAPENEAQEKLAAINQQIAETAANVRELENKLQKLASAAVQEANTEHPLSRNFKDAFIRMLDSVDPAVKASAVECLAALRVPFPEIQEQIMRLLDDEAPEVRSACVEAIRALSVPLVEVKDKLLVMLNDKDDDVRVKVLRLLIDLKVPARDVATILNRDYDRKEGLPPLDVIRGMADLGMPTERVKRDLLRDLENRDWLIQKYAMKGLILLRVPYAEIKDRLAQKLENRDLQIRLSAVRWLIAVAPAAEMKDELYAKLNDYYEEVRNEAVEGLSKLGLPPEELKKKLLEKIGDEAEAVQRTVFAMLSDLPVSLDDSKEMLLKKLDSKSSLVRLELIKCLLTHQIADERIKAAVLQLLDEGVEEAIPLMVRMGVSGDEVKGRFIDKLQSGDKFMQLEAIGALKAFHVPVEGIDQKLAGYASDPNPVIREAAMEIMIRAGMSVEDIQKTARDQADIGYILDAWDKVRAQNLDFEKKTLTGELAQERQRLAALRAEELRMRSPGAEAAVSAAERGAAQTTPAAGPGSAGAEKKIPGAGDVE